MTYYQEMSSESRDRADEETVAELKARVEQLESKVEAPSLSRRDVLAAGGGAGLLALLGGAGTAAAGNNEAGTIGEAANPIDVYGEDVFLQDAAADPSTNGQISMNDSDVKVYTGGGLKNMSNIGSGGSGIFSDSNGDNIYEQSTGDGLRYPGAQYAHAGYHVYHASLLASSGTGTQSTPFTNGLQATIDALDSDRSGKNAALAIVDGSWNETVTLPAPGGIGLSAANWESRIDGSSGDVITVNGDDCFITRLWVRSSGATNCIYATGNTATNQEELFMDQVEVEGGTNGFNLDGISEVRLNNSKAQSVSGNSIKAVGGNELQVSNFISEGDIYIQDVNDAQLSNIKSTGTITLTGNSFDSMVSNVFVDSASGDGLVLGTNGSQAYGVEAYNTGGVGIDIAADNCVAVGRGKNSMTADLQFTGATDSVAYGEFQNVVFDSNSSGCRLFGNVYGTVTNNGADCRVVDGDNVVASGSATLSSGSAAINTGISTSQTATFQLALGPATNDAHVAGDIRADSGTSTYVVDIEETDTSVGNPSVDYDIIRVR